MSAGRVQVVETVRGRARRERARRCMLRRKSGERPDPLLGSLTPAQWGFAGLFLLSTLVLFSTWAGPGDRPSPA
jgi:hypothetical protein